MGLNLPINFRHWIRDNRHLLKPPVGNRVVYDGTDFMIMVIGGPNSRKDYHVDPVEEFFYQLEGNMLLKVIEDDFRKDIPIKEGEIFFEVIIFTTSPFIRILCKGLSLLFISHLIAASPTFVCTA